MEKYNLYILNTLPFPEGSFLDRRTLLSLNSLFEQQDNLIDKARPETVETWMNSMSINSFEDIKESQNYLISLLKKARKLNKNEVRILDTASKIQKILSLINIK